jgi:hypothetical protein
MAFPWRLALVLAAQLYADDYVLGPDSQRQSGVPAGTVTKQSWISKIYPGTTRDYWVYVPSQYKPDKPACVMIFQDGGGMVTETGAWRVAIVFDNLINKGEMPVTIGIFINPGVLPASSSATQQNRYNRSYEYDALGDRYARFLIEEILPEVGKQYNLSKAAGDHAIAGSSSGGIAAFNAPGIAGRVSTRGQLHRQFYESARRGYARVAHPKDGTQAVARVPAGWALPIRTSTRAIGFLGNQEIYSALQYAGYESTFVVGTEGHNSKHGGSILPDALRWVWKDHPKPILKPVKVNDRGLYGFLEPGKEWELVGAGYQLTADSAVDKAGNIFFTSARITASTRSTWRARSRFGKKTAAGLMGSRLGRMAGCTPASMIANVSLLFRRTAPNRSLRKACRPITSPSPRATTFTLSRGRNISCGWSTPRAKNAWCTTRSISPEACHASTDQSLLAVNDVNSRWVWSFQIQPDGSLLNGQPFYRLEAPDESSEVDPSGMTFDTEGFLYVATSLGVQICDQAGRVVAILNPPLGSDGLGNVFFAGPNLQWLYATDGDKLYRRLMKHRGAATWNPVKPPQPRL